MIFRGLPREGKKDYSASSNEKALGNDEVLPSTMIDANDKCYRGEYYV